MGSVRTTCLCNSQVNLAINHHPQMVTVVLTRSDWICILPTKNTPQKQSAHLVHLDNARPRITDTVARLYLDIVLPIMLVKRLWRLALSATAFDRVHDLVVHDEHDGGAGATEDVGHRALEETGSALVLHDLREAVAHPVVHLVRLRLARLDLEATLHCVEGVCRDAGRRHGDLRDHELREQADGGHVLLPRVEGLDGVLETELHATVHDDANRGRSDPVVERHDAAILHGLTNTVHHVIVLLHLAEVSTEHSTDVDERVDERVRQASGHRTRSDLGGCEHGEVLLVNLREDGFQRVLEHQVEGSSGHVANAIGNISTPKRSCAKLRDVTAKSIPHSGVFLHLATQDPGVGVLVLDGEFDLLKGGRDGL